MSETNSKRQIKLTIAYDGTDYCGFQSQQNGPSVEETLNAALSRIAGHPVRILAASRTDAGVHAKGQVASFFLQGSIPTENICNAVNGLLPDDIAVRTAEEVPSDFHCRYHTTGKHYRYTVYNCKQRSPFEQRYSYHYPIPLNLAEIEAVIPIFLGEHDFEAFTATHSGRSSFVRQLDLITVTRSNDYVFFDFWGKAFLYKMVRSITGALIDIGRGFLTAETVAEALASKNRSLLSLTAPAKGLCLEKIYYNDEYYLDKDCVMR